MKKSIPYLIIVGNDSHFIQKKILEVAFNNFGSESQFNKLSFWGDETLPSEFWESLTLQSLFSTNLLLVLRNAQAMLADNLREVSEKVINCVSSTLPIICFEVDYEKGSPKLASHIAKLPMFLKAEKNNLINYLPEFNSANLPKYIKSELSKRQIKLSDEDINFLSTSLPTKASSIDFELDKIELCMVDNKLLYPLSSIINQDIETNVFSIISLIESGSNMDLVWKQIFEEELKGEISIFSLIALFMREARILWQLLSKENVFVPSNLRNKKINLANKLGYACIAKIWDICLYAEKSIKTGEFSPEQSLENFISNICNLFIFIKK